MHSINSDHPSPAFSSRRSVWAAWQRAGKLGLTLSVTTAFALLAACLLGVASAAAGPQTTPLEQETPAQATNVAITMLVDTPSSAGYVASAQVFNGDLITYEITILNSNSTPLTNVRVEDVLPTGKLDNIFCTGCKIISTTVSRPNALGETETVTVAREVDWVLPSPVVASSPVTLQLRARIVGQAGGVTVENTALLFFRSGAAEQSLVSNKVQTRIVQNIPTSAVTQASAVSDRPSWFSADTGGTLDMDWGDMDGDGDLDLALASTLGANVYRNDGGQLTQVWSDPQKRLTYGVRWVDVNGDGAPELVAVGQDPKSAKGSGNNFLYRYNPGQLQAPDRFVLLDNGAFTTTEQLARVEPGRFDSDAQPDLLVSANSIDSECPVQIFYNGAGGKELYQAAPQCVSNAATAALSAADFDNDGDLDAAIGIFPNRVQILVNERFQPTNPSTTTTPVTVTNFITIANQSNNIAVDSSSYFLPYDFAWGDVDGDGFLDLAAAFPLQREVRIYRNIAGLNGKRTFERITPYLNTDIFLTPYAIDFGDIDRDGHIDLVVADSEPTVYWNQRDPDAPFVDNAATPIRLTGSQKEVWNVRAVDQDGNGTLELALTNRKGPSMLLANYAPLLSPTLNQIADSGAAGSVVWGDQNGDGLADLLFGSPANRNSSRFFFNDNGDFSFDNSSTYDAGSIGVQPVAMIDTVGADALTVALATRDGVRLVSNSSDRTIALSFLQNSQTRTFAWGDLEGDGDLDLAVSANPGPLVVLQNDGGELSAARVISVANQLSATTSIAWGDFNGDHYMDLALGNDGEPNQILLNRGDRSFVQVDWGDSVAGAAHDGCMAAQTTAVAWADVDGDGDYDLAVGNRNGPNCLYINGGGQFISVSRFGPDDNATTSLDWGDYDNDGDLDLAVGNASQPVRTYVNFAGLLLPLWESSTNIDATAVRWGDKDNDGDLDLAVAQADRTANSGYFENNAVLPAHLLSETEAKLLPIQSAYVSVVRPGTTFRAYSYSTSELLAGPNHPTVTVHFNLYDPTADQKTPTIVKLLYEYSPDGGGVWRTATPHGAVTEPISLTLTRQGVDRTFVWDAGADGAISEDARFRVSVINNNEGPQVQAATGVGVSPPFQVRATTCTWPAGVTMLVNKKQVLPNTTFALPSDSSLVELEFSLLLAQGSGMINFQWNFDDGSAPGFGQRVRHSFPNGSYNVQVVATGPACPVARPATRFTLVRVGTGVRDRLLYLPIVTANTTSTVTSTVTSAAAPAPLPSAGALPAPLANFSASADDDGITLQWDGALDAQSIAVYRMALDDQAQAMLVASLPGTATTARVAEVCGVVLWVAAVNEAGETPTTGSYYAAPCRGQS